MAMIIALGTTVNVFAQERNLKIYFNEYSDTATGPRILVTDDHPNDEYDVPLGVTVSRIEGVAWAGKSTDVTDRVMADYLSKNDKKNSHLKLTFTDFPYEVNVIQWNAMNDLLSGSVTDFFKNYRVTTKCVPMSGNGFAYTEENWSLNLFSKQTSFTQMDVPWKSGAVLNGLTSFEISELYEVKIGLFGLTLIDLGQTELSDKNRTFIKAGWNGSNTNSNITDSDDSNWAFKVKFTLPDIRMRSYKCTVDNNFNVTLGQTDNNIIVGERAKHALRGYIAAHAGAVVPIEAPTNPDDIDPDAFHYKYEADETKINIHQHTGVIYEAKVAGDIPVTVKLMRGSREVCSYTQTIHVYSNDPTRSEIAIGFLNGNKGYDVTVGDQNAQIQGFITKYGENNITLSNGISGYHFEYSEDSNGEIIDIDPLTGKITAKKEGDVVVSAVLKNGGTIRSNTYTYSLHVFAQHEGLDWKLEKTYTYTNSSNINEWKISTKTTNSSSNEWESKDLLMVNTTINGSSDWKQIACFTTPASRNWRGICQTIQFDLRIPKYTKVTGTYPLAGNLNIGSSKGSSIKYGFESKDLSAVDAATADTNVKEITWLTQGSHDATHASTNKYATQIIADATSYNNGNIGNEKDYRRSLDNLTSEHVTKTRYLAIMAYLHRDNSYPGDASFGFKNIPTYEYYSTVTYYKNDGTEDVWYKTDTPLTTTDKTKSFKMPNTKKNLPERAGYEFLGWSTDPNATTAEYPGKDGDFYPYDDVNGGGKGPVDLYAVWRANVYTVELRHTSTGPVDGYVYAIYDQNMPSVDIDGNSVEIPKETGYDFNGYYAERYGGGNKYYNLDMSSNHVWDRTDKNYVIAQWMPHKIKVVFDPQGGNNYGATYVTATYGQAMPTEGVQAPQRQGYTFGGYYSKQNGAGTQYYTIDMTSARTWNIDEPEVTLYAKWIPIQYAVTLDKQGGTGGSSSVTASYGQPLPSGLTAPTKPGYEFRGYYGIENSEWEESQGHDIYYGGKEYYDKDMNGVEPWDKTEGGTIYAHWAPATYIVTLDANGGVLPTPVVEDNVKNFDITKVSNSVMTISIVYNTGKTHDLVHSTAKKPGYELLGWYDSNGVKVISVDEKSRNSTITDAGGYWTGDGGKYVYPGNLTLTAHYRQKYQTPSENVIAFDNEKVEAGEDWLWAVVNDLVGSAQEVYQKTGKQTMVFDLSKSINMWTGSNYNCQLVMEELQKPENSEFISPNVLVYFNDKSYNANKCNNAILSDYTCPNLYVTDRFQMKIPYAFNAGKATYERNKLQIDTDDPMWQQSHKSIWGTLCLPYPIKNNNTYKDVSKVIFYELRKHSGNVMQFYKLPEDAEIPANTPVLYERTVGISSAVTIEEISKNIYEPSIYVPENPDITAVVKSYADAPEPSIHDWEFRGNLKTRVFYGANYVGTPEEADAEIVNNGDIYYFKENKFTHLTPTMTKMVNGQEKWYNAGKMTIYPYRAYFYKKGTGGSAKIASYSILVVDEFGNTTDITNTVFGDGEGDGKIYDLNGIRVMQPVKGRLYIVNGQKKVYR